MRSSLEQLEQRREEASEGLNEAIGVCLAKQEERRSCQVGRAPMQRGELSAWHRSSEGRSWAGEGCHDHYYLLMYSAVMGNHVDCGVIASS